MKIMLDAGHGPKYSRKREVLINLKNSLLPVSVADHAKTLLEAYENVTIYLPILQK